MNIDELAESIRGVSDEPLMEKLAGYIEEWKQNDKSAEELREMVERFFGNAWIPSDEDHSKAYQLWEAFRNEAIQGIGGMTVNERLYWFGLFERFDSCNSEKEKLVVYAKVHAKP